MGFLARVKKLTSYVYSPTNPASEDAIRTQIDDSIQEVYDNVQSGFSATDGASLVGYSGGYADVEEALQAFESGGSGTIPPDGSITNGKLATDVKVGSLASLNTTVKTDVVSAINEVDGNVDTNTTNLDINRIAELDTGAANAYVVTTSGTFSRTDGNILNFIPNNNNTGASTMNEDGNGVAAIQKYVDGAWVALEEGDLKKFQQVQLVWNASESAFQLAPKGGATIKSLQSGIVTFASQQFIDVTVSYVDLTKAIVKMNIRPIGGDDDSRYNPTSVKILNATTLRFERRLGSASAKSEISWELIEFNGVKSIQSGSVAAGATTNQTISSVDTSKSVIFVSFRQLDANLVTTFLYSKTAILTSATNLQLKGSDTGYQSTVEWQVLEFK